MMCKPIDIWFLQSDKLQSDLYSFNFDKSYGYMKIYFGTIIGLQHEGIRYSYNLIKIRS